MHFLRNLRSPAKVDETLQRLNEQAAEQVAAVGAEGRSQREALRVHFNKIEKQIQDFLAGATPADAIDMKGFRKFLTGNEEPEPAHPTNP